MMTLIREGGFPMWFVLLFGSLSLAAAARFARSADRRHLGLVIGASLATLFTILMGFSANFSAVFHKAPRFVEDHPDVPIWAIYSQGFGEALAPGIIGFTLLSLTALIATVGLNRAATRA